jgi:aldose 1-epimerase
MQEPISPSGEQVELSLGDQRVVVVGVGGGLRRYSAGDESVLDGYSVVAMCGSGRGQLLAPWPNRVQDGSYEFDGETYQLALDEPERRNAIHGLVRWSKWTVAEHQADLAALEHRLHPTPGYPFTLDLRVEYSLAEDGLTVQVEATNVGDEACPYGFGTHPYLSGGDDLVDGLELRIPAETALISDERSIPIGRQSVDGTELDFRTSKPIGPVQLDHCFTDLVRDRGGRASVDLSGRATLWVDESYPYVMIFTGDALPDVSRRSVAVEPMTCAPNAFRSGDGLIRLEPGQSHSGSWGIMPAHT